MSNELTRRSFVKWGTVAAGATALVGFSGCAPTAGGANDEELPATAPSEERGEWLTGACMNNCGGNRCLLRVYVEDGVPLKIRTDEEIEDTIDVPQRRACPRGRAQISNMLSPARVKYPMKRKSWNPGDPQGELRGRDEWERISWDEAMDYVAAEMKKTLDADGTRGILAAAYSNGGVMNYFDPVICVLNSLGGALHPDMATVSFGSWPMPTLFMTGSPAGMIDVRDLPKSELHVFFGFNMAVNRAGTRGHLLSEARKAGAKVIAIDPWLSQTSQALADEWVPVLPGTDTALCIGMAYHMIENNLHDQAYLDKYCVGFDAEHMPEGADIEDNFKDYVLGTYDSQPKTPEWAEAICGLPAERIRALADEICSAKTVNFVGGWSTTKHQAGEMFAQVFYTLALMRGGIGTEGNYMSWFGPNETGAAGSLTVGDATFKADNPVNAINPPGLVYNMFSLPDWSQIEDPDSWDCLDYTECWQSILNGSYGRDEWPGGKKKIDIHMIYTGGYANYLNSMPNANAGIEAHRKMDFVWGARPFFDASAQYCDVLLPISPWWEKGRLPYSEGEVMYWWDRIMDPLYESKDETFVADELAKRLGIEPAAYNAQPYEKRTYAALSGALYIEPDGSDPQPLFTITQEDIDAMGVEGAPQEGRYDLREFQAKGVCRIEPPEEVVTAVPFAAFYADPETNPLTTSTGKFEIYSAGLANYINTAAFSTISPIGKWQASDEQGQGAQTDEYPLLLWTPHTLRRAHTCNDNVASLREAFPQACYMSQVDATARGIESGDVVLMSSPHGKVLRYAKVIATLIPGAVAMEDGAWTRIDEATGIDLGGNPNILQAPSTSGEASTSWGSTLVQVEKYDGPLTLDPDKNTPVVVPVGIEE